MKNILNNRATWLWLGWTVATVGMIGSLYFSEFAGYEPCKLCWFQRIATFPIVIIGIVGYLNRDWKWYRYGLPLAIGGGLISLYHNLLQWGVVKEVCSAVGPRCVQTDSWFGFITIPLLSLLAYVVITFSLVMARKLDRKG